MSRMFLRSSYVFLALFGVMLFATSSFLPNVLNADVPEETCEDEADTVSDATDEFIQQHIALTLSMAAEANAAAALAACEMNTPGQCGSEQSDWDLALQLVDLGLAAVAAATATLQNAQAAYADCVANGGAGHEEAESRVAQAVEFKAPVIN